MRLIHQLSIWLTVLITLFLCIPVIGEEITIYGTIQDRYSGVPLDSVLVTIDIPVLQRTESVLSGQDGSWNFRFQTTGVAPPSVPIPSSFALDQNYPNPFSNQSGSPTTRINFSIYQAGQVTLRVYNVLGQLLDERTIFLNRGRYYVDWSAKGVPGFLFYSLEMNHQRLTRKMLQLDHGQGGLGDIRSMAEDSNDPWLEKPGNLTAKIKATKLGYEPDSVEVTLPNELPILIQLDWLHRKALVIDLHNDVLEKVVDSGYQLGVRHSYNHSDLPRFFDGGVDAQMFVAWVDPDRYLNVAYQKALQFFDAFDRQVALNSHLIAQAKTADEIIQICEQGKLAGVLVVEGGHAIENDLNKLKQLYQRGMRYMTITWNNSTDWATSARDSRTRTRGLSEFGKQVIRTLDSLGVIIDVSHVGIKTIEDIIAITKNPIIASHSGARALNDHYRNLYDDQIRAIASTGGVIGVVFYPPFLTPYGRVDISTVIKHIDHIVKLVGVDHVALGSDFDGIETTPVGLENVSKFPDLTMALLKHGYSNSDVKKILGENYLRVFRQVCH
ncbi:MAG: dipeptidase [candidate division KSB1 bacterium]|nr:dipeptidase [candidate division KSB1 bacterium]MDZ7335089.1 dipeptidase [candidate division KSB1 bacterium]MDZ7356242.1 dipeptidase [candidate division KSB1 bacterium]MDZ7375768.1 dipeptidase [candidate division KSB1 bacterium]MDZ7400047.1 dipeptidase [candidate division KSB1 bacterium]